MLEDNLLSIGTITNTFGTKGVVKLVLKNEIEVIGNLTTLKVLFHKTKVGALMPLQIESISQKGQTLLIKFINFNNINDVEKMKNYEIWCLNEPKIFAEALNFLTMKVKTETEMGIVIDIMNNGAQDLIKVQLDNCKKAFWVPVVDQFVQAIDEANQLITLQNVEGLK